MEAVPAREAAGTYVAYDCMGAPSGLPIYELQNTRERFYSISEVETRYAVSAGYTRSLFARACIAQPHDSFGTVRLINILREFRNLTTKF